MLTSFFRKSKPIQFLLVGVFMTIYFVLANFILLPEAITWVYVAQKLGILLVYLLMMFIINFIVKRNEVTQRNTFTIILFAVFTVLIWPILRDSQQLLAGFFLLLAIRRIISLHSGTSIFQKIFDTSFWIAVASLFFPPAILFIVVPFFGIMLYAPQEFKTWLIPWTAIFAVFILQTTCSLLLYGHFFNPLDFYALPEMDFASYRSAEILIPISVLLAFSIWTFYYFMQTIQKATQKMKGSGYLVVVTWVVAVFAVLLSPEKTGSELLFFIIPVCVMGANYFQQQKEKVFKEVLLDALIVLAVLLPFFR